MNPQTDWPAPDEERQLLTELGTGIPTARQAIAARFHTLLTQFLERAVPRAAPELIGDAVDRALVDFLCSPQRFDPTRGDLGRYLRVAARRDLLNLLDGERRARRGIALDSVAEPADHRNWIRDEELTWDDPRLTAELAAFDTTERTAFELMRGGVRKMAVFVARLGLTHLAADEQAVAVKRIKGRVWARLVRAVEDSR
ncbi:MAG: hypothetical protein J0I06_17995 [Planctomycetes bacterium]|nr:hypothetical protein [Planctomycetota bacterium]